MTMNSDEWHASTEMVICSPSLSLRVGEARLSAVYIANDCLHFEWLLAGRVSFRNDCGKYGGAECCDLFPSMENGR